MNRIYLISQTVLQFFTFLFFKICLEFKIYGENYEKYEKAKKYFEENPTAEAKLSDKMAMTPGGYPNKK